MQSTRFAKHSLLMRRATLSALAFTATLSLGTTASAQAPTDLDGTYALTCERARIAISLQRLEVTGDEDSVILDTPMNQAITLEAPCSLEDVAVYDAKAECMAKTAGLANVDGLRESICTSVAQIADRALDHLVRRLNGELTVAVGGPWATWLNLYNMKASLENLEGESMQASYLVHTSGRFLTASVLPGVFRAGPLCATTLGLASQSVSGEIAREDEYTLTADYNADVSLLCALPTDDPNQRAAGRFGVTFHADLVGQR